MIVKIGLLALELRGSFFEKSFHSFIAVFTGEGLRQEFAFKSQSVGERELGSRGDRSLGLADGETALVGHNELTRIIHHFFHEVLFLIDVVNQPHLESLFKWDELSRRTEFHRSSFAYETRQALCSTHPDDHAVIELRQADSAAFFFG